MTKRFPFGKFAAINLFGRLFIKDNEYHSIRDIIMRPEVYISLIEHERTHTYQQKELLYVFFFIWYCVEWVFKLFTTGRAYWNLSFEREARYNSKYCDAYSVNVKIKHQKKFRIYTKNNGKYYNNISKAIKSIKDLEYIEYKPFNERGKLVDRRWCNWIRFLFKKTL